MSEGDSAVISTAKEQQDETGIYTLSSGVRVQIKPVSISLITDVQSKIKYPDPPMVYIERMGRDEPNTDDPHYKRQCTEVEQAKGQVAIDACAMFALELVDGMPQDTGWLTKLKLLGIELDDSDPVSCEFYYKKYIVIGGPADLNLILARSTVSDQGVQSAEDSFPDE